jgi:hypothetical protein
MYSSFSQSFSCLEDILDDIVGQDETLKSEHKQPIVKRVSFNLYENMEYETKQNKKDLAELSYSRCDYRNFRCQRYDLAMKLRQVEAAAYERVTIRAYKACCEATPHTESVLSSREKLLLMMQFRDAKVLGMETDAFKAVSENRSDLRTHLVDVVVALQDDPDADSELIRAHSESVSQSARFFAREVALAVAAGM